MTNKPRFSVTMDPDLVEKIEEYGHSHRISTQSKAIQQLVRVGIRSVTNNRTPTLTNGDGLDEQERELIQFARDLDPAQKTLLLRLVETAVENQERPRDP